MYCANCGTPLAQGLSYCNRCGTDLRERKESKNTGAISAFLTAITVIAAIGLGVMLAGALVLRNAAGLGQELVGFFMLFTFLIVSITEIMLVKNLAKLLGSSESKSYSSLPQHVPGELRPQSAASLGEPVSSVTENTTRTLDYARREH